MTPAETIARLTERVAELETEANGVRLLLKSAHKQQANLKLAVDALQSAALEIERQTYQHALNIIAEALAAIAKEQGNG